jgi:hypothetical protein
LVNKAVVFAFGFVAVAEWWLVLGAAIGSITSIAVIATISIIATIAAIAIAAGTALTWPLLCVGTVVIIFEISFFVFTPAKVATVEILLVGSLALILVLTLILSLVLVLIGILLICTRSKLLILLLLLLHPCGNHG